MWNNLYFCRDHKSKSKKKPFTKIEGKTKDMNLQESKITNEFCAFWERAELKNSETFMFFSFVHGQNKLKTTISVHCSFYNKKLINIQLKKLSIFAL